MKRFVVLLVLMAGGLAAASLSVPSNAAVVNGQSISQDQLNSDLTAIAKSPEYACYLNAQVTVDSQGQAGLPSVQGAGQQSADGPHTTATSAFVASYLDTVIRRQIVLQVAAKRHLKVTSAGLGSALAQLRAQISGTASQVSGTLCTTATGQQVLDTMPSPFVQQSVRFAATVTALEQALSGIGSSTSALRGFFVANRSSFDSVCITVATYSSASAAQAAKALVYEGATFASVAKTANGGPQGCPVLSRITSQLPSSANLQSLPLNTVSDPIVINGGYLLIEFTSRSPVPFGAVKTDVQRAVLTIGAANAQQVVSAAYVHAHVTLNPRYGVWKPTAAAVIVPSPPPLSDVLNATVNAPPTAATASSGSSAATGQSG